MSEPKEECEHEWEVTPAGVYEVCVLCVLCGAAREYDGTQDDGRDFTPPYEP